MKALNIRQKRILSEVPFPEDGISVTGVFEHLKKDGSLVSVRRDLRALVELGYLVRVGSGPSTVYKKTVFGALMTPFDSKNYQEKDPDRRAGRKSFNFDLFKKIPTKIFSEEEYLILNNSTAKYLKRNKTMTENIKKKELERFIIEMSWKSSKIEGNTYTLLDTERLIKDGVYAEGHSKNEGVMILNHKKSFSFILENLNSLLKKGLQVSFIEKVHELLVEYLQIDKGVRKSLVGVTGTSYVPLDNQFQIKEALSDLCDTVNRMESSYDKALMVLVGISYIQPFVDGNKRTARLIANALLLAGGCAPLSYRSVDEVNYRESILVFYEQNSVLPMKEIFIEQYIFACENYLVG